LRDEGGGNPIGRFNALTGQHGKLGMLRGAPAPGSGQALANGFQFAFLACAAMSILGFAIALTRRDRELWAAPAPQAE
jgi:hypothetical protein